MAFEKIAIVGRELSRSFGSGEATTVAVRNVSLEVCAGQMSLLMGPSGSGKTTLLAVLSGLLHPDDGEVTVLGEDIWRMSDRQREAFRLRHCGFIFQGANLLPALTAHDHLEMVLRWGTDTPSVAVERKVSDMLALLGLESKADLCPSTCPAEKSSASPSAGRSSSSRTCSSPTSRPAPSTGRTANSWSSCFARRPTAAARRW